MKNMIKKIFAAIVVLTSIASAQNYLPGVLSNDVPVNPARVILWRLDGCNTDNATATYSFYRNLSDDSPLWQESQPNADRNNYSYVGNTSGGVPTDIFSNGSAGWLEQACSGDTNPAPRVALTAVPYAISSMDSASLGGRPASDYALASQLTNAPDVNVSEKSRAQEAESNLFRQVTNEAHERQSAFSSLQLDSVASASQLASLNAAIVSLQSRIAALERTNTSLSALVAALSVRPMITQSPVASTAAPTGSTSNTAAADSSTPGVRSSRLSTEQDDKDKK